MTILSLINADGSGTDLDITTLFQEVKTRTSVDLLGLLPHTHLAQGYYTDTVQGGLLAILTRLRASQEIKSLKEIFKPERDLTSEELSRKSGAQHNITTIDNVAWIRMNVPVYDEDPEVTAIVNEFNTFIDFLKEGAESGADLANSDYPETPVEQVAPESEAEAEVEEPAPEVPGSEQEEEEVPVAVSTNASVVDGVPQEEGEVAVPAEVS